MRPYTPLEQMGRNIYVREGCYLCHSQQIRPFKDEVERYGHYSLAAESMYDQPFQWGSKRTGPDLARVGGTLFQRLARRASDLAARGRAGERDAGLSLPRRSASSSTATSPQHLKALRAVGMPYTDEMIANARADLEAQVNPDARSDRAGEALPARRRRQVQRRIAEITEMDALVAYLQMLGTLVRFADLPPDRLRQ